MARIMIIGRGLIATELVKELRPHHEVTVCSVLQFHEYYMQHKSCNHEKCMEPDDLAIICCAPKDTAAVVERLDKRTKIIDTSYIYRTDPEWVYGLHEISGDKLIGADRVANAGCIATGVMLLLNPLRYTPNFGYNFLVNVTCGASAGGAMLLDEARKGKLPEEYMKLPDDNLPHPHVPEIKKYLDIQPTYFNVVIVPKIVSGVDQGMRVDIMLWSKPYDSVLNPYINAYRNNKNIDIIQEVGYIAVDDGVGSDKAKIYVNEVSGGTMVTCTFDNLRYAGVDNIKRNIEMMLNLNQGGM